MSLESIVFYSNKKTEVFPFEKIVVNFNSLSKFQFYLCFVVFIAVHFFSEKKKKKLKNTQFLVILCVCVLHFATWFICAIW